MNMFKRKRPRTNWSNNPEFKRLSEEFYAALANLPDDWRDVAEGKATLPETLDDARAQRGRLTGRPFPFTRPA
jgi:hypothetical protein